MRQNCTTLEGTAILIFAYSAEKEIRSKQSLQDRKLFQSLNSHTLKTVKKTGLPFYHLSEKEQLGDTFGERFTNAIQAIYDKGFDNVIAIGNDSPQLKPIHLLEVYRQLQDKKTVLGPSSDGGFYVVGLHRSKFNPEQFLSLPWQQTDLFRKIFGLLRGLGSVIHVLPKLHDIDSVDDIALIIEHKTEIPVFILRILKNFEVSIQRFFLKSYSFESQFFLGSHYNKGSPSLTI